MKEQWNRKKEEETQGAHYEPEKHFKSMNRIM